jgi:hypothetical protein
MGEGRKEGGGRKVGKERKEGRTGLEVGKMKGGGKNLKWVPFLVFRRENLCF